ncbi:hypothetical protein [Cylindrospermopsis raciborskii]
MFQSTIILLKSRKYYRIMSARQAQLSTTYLGFMK